MVCLPRMNDDKETLTQIKNRMSYSKGIFGGCGTAANTAKYTTGHHSPNTPNAAQDIFGPGSASTPKIKAYIDWMKTIKQRYGTVIKNGKYGTK